ncbi:helix-turn-helix transcriptional regulator [Halorussus salinisoli]|uniref:helix-turn-helix transcriptional regulator n=1 Tax=Halorussus salinisoli TaxID=2558242 RepID=UPI0010C19F42|nr:GntR family transcriptional regulator [Halorussus salinisoli]
MEWISILVVDRKQPPTQLIALVQRRYDFLAVLDTDTYDKRSLEEKLDVSRSTVDRALRDLESAALAHRTPDGYRTTLYGGTLLAIYNLVLDYVGQVQRAEVLLPELPRDIDFSVSLLIDAEILVAEEPALHAPTSRIADLIDAASEVRGLAYAHTSPDALELFQQQIVSEGMPTEIVFRERMYQNFRATAPDILESLMDADCYTAYVTPDVPFGLFLPTIDGSEHVCLVVYDNNKNVRGIIVNDTAEAVAWGTRLFERYRTQAQQITDGPEARTQ